MQSVTLTSGSRQIDNKDVNQQNLIPLLRGVDVIGSHVKIDLVKAETSQALTFNLTRSDIRSVEKMKDLYMKLAELQAEARCLCCVSAVSLLPLLSPALSARKSAQAGALDCRSSPRPPCRTDARRMGLHWAGRRAKRRLRASPRRWRTRSAL